MEWGIVIFGILAWLTVCVLLGKAIKAGDAWGEEE